MTGPRDPRRYCPPEPLEAPRRRAGLIVAVVLGLVVVLGAGVTYYLVKSQQDGARATGARVPAPAPEQSRSPRPVTTKAAATTTRRSRPPGTTPPRRTSTPTPTVSPADLLQRNDLYKIPAIGDAGCAGESAAALDSVAGVRAFYSSMMPCLNAAWSQLRTSKLPFRAPRLVVHSGEPISDCGALAYSFYCPREQTIYMYAPEMITPWQQYSTDYSHRITRLAAEHTIAHEYGHHLQYLTGIFGAIGPDWSGTVLERQLELQASCFGNAFLSSQRAAYPISSADFADEDLWRFITRVPNHGAVGNQKLWSERGYENRKPGACVTFAAPRTEVG